MSKTARTNVILCILTVIVGIFAIFFAFRSDKLIKNGIKQGIGTPTIYVHGLNGSLKSTNHLVTVASRDGGTKALIVYVAKNGDLSYEGHLDKHMKNPLIQVNFKNNDAPVSQQVDWLHKILINLKQKYHYENYNAVGHSAGCVSILQTTALYGHDSDMPQLQKFVSIAGPYNGVIGINDRPHSNLIVNSYGKPQYENLSNKWYPAYSELLKECKNFPKGVQILNIYGNYGKMPNSDGYVSIPSARSLQYLVHNKAQGYQGIQINGNNAQHSRLHSNPVVDRLTSRFLFDNN
ncbi:alpha/beta hydrolase [Apilactobacillus sp. TMW 2.2459]|uniref:Alpha/beta hydrolase n=1 Tax=Apilactobacillus xinyiensis TaxID=2841032 RepID=A0ABT0I0V4_9LACO|nr:alpha/beta hydrolase [Apilactobacillus xinyiensis]MCK8624450.1 alpha/beta hydrolase [Apilactobacillus xinyiensis]MCL0312044.1 alpha/beta hydrolase [Apilactobacillus xinyiensis]MCL0318683.1 alpha/beta hydrolase [Apilactobacillus xinyiensis]